MNRGNTSNDAIPDVQTAKLPVHVAAIMDGNGRWASRRSLPRIAGHRKGADAVRKLIAACGDRDIPYLTLFAFSSENWRRPQPEVRRLMELFLTALEKDVKELHENEIRFQVIGDMQGLSKEIVRKIAHAETLTKDNKSLTLTVAINYGGRWDITQACSQVAEKLAAGLLQVTDITPEILESFLSTRGLPEPDLFIRTGGEHRISNFLLWQLAYTELYFTDVLWPDFDREAFDRALFFYAGRQRRFGQTGEQVKAG